MANSDIFYIDKDHNSHALPKKDSKELIASFLWDKKQSVSFIDKEPELVTLKRNKTYLDHLRIITNLSKKVYTIAYKPELQMRNETQSQVEVQGFVKDDVLKLQIYDSKSLVIVVEEVPILNIENQEMRENISICKSSSLIKFKIKERNYMCQNWQFSAMMKNS